MDYSQWQQELAEVAGKCSARGIQTNNGGNLSMRIPQKDCMLVKATDVSFTDCKPEDFVLADFQSNLLAGLKKPSKETKLHGYLYQNLTQVGAIIHCHSPWATASAAYAEQLPFSTYHSALKLCAPVVILDSGSYVVDVSFYPKIMEIFYKEPKTKAFILKGHGVVALGKDLRDALYTAELVEETAQIAGIEKLFCYDRKS